MSYTGTLLKNLQSMVEARLQWDGRICAFCRQRYEDHSFAGSHCPISASAGPLYLQTSIAEKGAKQVAHTDGVTPMNCGSTSNG